MLDRKLSRLTVTPIFGEKQEFSTASDAILFVEGFEEDQNRGGSFQKYEIIAKYSNGDYIDALFNEKDEALRFIQYIAS